MNGENKTWKKLINIFLVSLIAFSAMGIPVSAETTEENNETTQAISEVTGAQEVTQNLYASSFDLTVSELSGLTKESLIEKAGAYTNDESTIEVDSESFNTLKETSGGASDVILRAGEEELTIIVNVKADVAAATAITPLITEIDDKLEVSIPDYVEASGMDVRNIYDISLKVNFEDSTSSNKKLTFTLPQGFKYMSYPTNNVTISGIETKATGVLGDFIQNVTPPVRTLGTNYSGNLVYEFVPGTVAIEINIKIQVDEILYLRNGAIAGDIIAKAEKNGTTIGEVSFLNVKTVGAVTPTLYAAGETFTKNVLQEGEVSTTKVSVIKTVASLPAAVETNARKYTLYYYYPKEMTYVSSSHDSLITEKNFTAGYIKFETGSANLPYITLKLKAVGLAEAVYTATRTPYVEIEAYNGEIITVNGTATGQTLRINVQNSASVPNKLGGSIFRHGFYHNYDSSYTSTGPYFEIVNSTAKDLEKQWYEVTINPNYQTSLVGIPDISVNTKVYYQTNLNSTLRQVPTSAIGLMPGTTHKSVSSSKLGLASGEYLTVVKAYLGTVPMQYYSYDIGSRDYITRLLGVSGKLAPGITTATVVVKTYEADAETDAPVAGTVLTLSSSIKRTDNPITTVYRTIPTTTITAGETKTVSTSLVTNRYPSTSETSALVDPVVYIKLIDGMKISNPVATIAGVTKTTTFVEEYTTTQGERFARIEVDGLIGAYIDDKIQDLALKFDVSINLQASSQTFSWNDLVFVKDEINTYGGYWNNANPVADVYDVDNDGNLTELLMPMGAGNTKLIINSNENLLIDTYIYPVGESRRPAYDGTDAKAVGFTPGTHGVYTVDILNNVDGVARDIETYIPVPKVGNDYGSNFQNAAFKWNMKLGAVPVLVVEDENGNDITAAKAGNYKITYSSDATTEANYKSATYSTIYDPNTSLIKATNVTGMNRGERAYITFAYIVDENTASITLNPEKLGAINDFRPYYTFNAGSVAGGLSGTRVGARLDIGVVEGIVFKDTNYNGIYDAGVDTLVSGKTVSLYKKDSSNVYQFVTNAITSATGTYNFEDLSNGVYKVDFNGALSINQRFTIKNAGSDDSLDSDVEITGTDSGTIVGIDPTSQNAKQISAGVVDYELAAIDITKTSTTIKAVNAQQPNITELLATIITPTYFDKIKVGNIVWSSNNTSIVTIDSDGYIKGLTAGTATLTAKITDIYGHQTTDTITVTVTSNTIPVVSGSNMTIEAGTTFDKLTTGVTISDTEDGAIALTDAKVTITDNVPVNGSNRAVTPGTYTVIYAVEDADGNTASKTINVTVQDTTAPAITTTNTTLTVEANNNSTLPVWETVFGVTVNDIVDGDITADTSKVTYSVSSSYTANNVPGTYTITVSSTDTATNNSTTTLTYIVQDTTTPSITTTDTTKTVEANDNSTLPVWETVFGVAVNDIVDGTITTDTSKVTYSVSPAYTANNIPGTYTITVGATDAASNNATQTLTYIVQDTTVPVITTTDTTKTVEANSTSTLPIWETVFGVAVNDIVDGNITANTSKVAYNVSPAYTANNVPGTYTITISGTDAATNNATKTVTYIVEDTTAPVITTTNTSVTVEANNNATLPNWGTVFGVAVNDIVDGDITANTSKVTYSVSPSYTANNVPGTYTITVSATDAATNNSTTTVTYIVQDTTIPTLTIANTTVYVAKNDTQTEAELITLVGATATDVTGTPTVNINMTALDFNTVGTYGATVSAKDATNNTATGSITVEVIELITAENFTVVLADVPSTDFVTKANASGWELNTSVTTPTASAITLESSKPTTVGTHNITFKNAENVTITVQVLVTNEAPVNNETVTASNFAVKLADVATADFITLANAKGYDITDPTTPIEIPVTEITTRPTTVGTHTVRFETANGGYAEVQVLVTNEAPVNNETVVANNFTIKLADVTTADFIALANAKGYDITNPASPIEVPVTEVTARPTTVGTHTVRFETVNGGYAEVQVLVTNETPVNNETVVANNFTIKLSDVATADFITLANAKGYDVTNPATPIEILVTEVTARPTTVGIHTVRFETANGGYAEVQVLVTNEAPVNNETLVANNFTIKLSDVATADFVTLANAKGYDITNPTSPIEVPVTEVTVRPTTVGTHTVRFETANGGYAEIQVLVTNESPVNNETVVANNFTIKLSDVATADFITLASAKGYDITNPATPIEIPVTEVTARPTTVGTHTVRFETANGGYAEIQVLVTNAAPVNNETVVANNFTIKLSDVAVANFITLANAKGYDITNPAIPIEIAVLEISARPTTVGIHTVRFETANGGYAEIQALVTNEPPINNETVTASGFTIKLSDVATADFITLANAKGYDITDINNPIEIPVTLVSAKPTTMGTHTARFETANGGYAEIQVLVTNEAPVSNETVVANNFTIKLSDVATADFITLANAKGYDITNPASPIEISVTEVTARPTTVGTHTVRFETANGGYAEIQVLVTNEAPINNETVTANGFTIKLADVATADFILLANAKGYNITDINNPIEIPVTLISTKPTTIGTHTARFETANGGYAEVSVEVVTEISDYELSANHIVMGISALQNAINNSNLNETIISESDAKVVNTITGEAKTDSIDVEVKDLSAPEVKVYNVVLSYEHNNVSAFSTNSETTSTVITKEITLSVENDNNDTDDQSQSELPKSGQHTKEFYIIGVFLLMLNALIINYIVKKKRKINR